jgi:ribosome biogenesis GTPase / thiamine phosphate phosphatase
MQHEHVGQGRRHDLSAELEALGEPDLTAGRVIAQHRGHWLVADPGGTEPRLLPARGRLRETPPVTGDWVAISPDEVISTVLERRGTVVRRAAGSATSAQVLAANVDLALVAEPLPEPNERRVERLVALGLADDVPAVLLLTKADLDPDAQLTATQLARRLGLVDAVAISTRDGGGLGVLRTLLEPGATAVLLGPSGAGKSTLVNALLGEERQATAEIREDGRGRHTTVTRELISLPGGALLVDTPGIREVGLWDGPGATFADIDELAARCRFADCQHDTEPGCAVRDATDPERLEAWRKLAREQKWLEDRKAAARERDERGRSYKRVIEESHRAKGRQ